jgi:hypothetical protein
VNETDAERRCKPLFRHLRDARCITLKHQAKRPSIITPQHDLTAKIISSLPQIGYHRSKLASTITLNLNLKLKRSRLDLSQCHRRYNPFKAIHSSQAHSMEITPTNSTNGRVYHMRPREQMCPTFPSWRIQKISAKRLLLHFLLTQGACSSVDRASVS